MADLKTNYVDDVLDSSKNQLRKYQQIQNDDGTVSFVDVTEYSTTGTSFGAKDINDTNAAVNELNESLGSINSNLVDVRTDVSQNSADIQTIASAQIPESTVSNAVTNYVNSHSGEFATKTDVSELKGDLTNIENLTCEEIGNTVYSNGYMNYVEKTVQSHSDYEVSERVFLKKNDKVFYDCFALSPVAIVKEIFQSGTYKWNSKIPFYVQGNGSYTNGVFTADHDMCVVFSYDKRYEHRFIKYTGYSETYKGYSLYSDTFNSGYYSGDGHIYPHDDYEYSNPIKLNVGDEVIINYRDGGDTIPSIVRVNKDGSYISTIKNMNNSFHQENIVSDDFMYISIIVCKNVYYNVYIKRNNDIVKTPFCDLSLFRRIGVIGDSYASGELVYQNASGETVYRDKYDISWGQILARKHGITCTNYSMGGLTTKTWLTNSKGLSLLNSSTADNLYLLALGINDISQGISYLGTIADIESKADSFYGNYASIIDAIQSRAPHAKIIMFTVAQTNQTAVTFNEAIKDIANAYGIPYIVQLEDAFFGSSTYKNQRGSHPRAIAYSGMACAFERLLNNCFIDNPSYFNDTFMYD